jgi:hypothetical protein
LGDGLSVYFLHHPGPGALQERRDLSPKNPGLTGFFAMFALQALMNIEKNAGSETVKPSVV